MAVKLRLTRLGSKKRPFYRIVAMDINNKRDGRALEYLGYYNPLVEPATIKLDMENIKKWLDCGAIPTETVKSLLRRA